MDTIKSRNGVLIRLPDERWEHIIEEHGELSGLLAEVMETIRNPERILAGGMGELLAIREIQPGKYLAVVYREEAGDGFLITAFLTRRIRSMNRRKQLWP